ncbi:bifunctional 5,10-methylenetetrahydrofolate dehydrogenase/5,10-methenyltetrahydrofolate cyclohydrolase [Fusobacterium russii]|uniref:bifunctional 5,10-methylenetetrahydrofolate dehydrogenase/5,10-methenyltetrahydrofolate cyclohydrolase n=1 Tax=Fusobacterium russii TaxID=854 RepID=UPI00039E71A1|nr:bifunctional 5,10-methylenetetrahydrofolate dehydrogenase/5,10-methenyltetrahydrofolate cyclohydrolase [Fusobacterium russii]
MLMDGKKIAKEIKEEIKAEIDRIREQYKIFPEVALIMVGKDPASEVYINSQINLCKTLGIEARVFFFENNITEQLLLDLIEDLNNSPTTDGIMLNLPLPKHMNVTKILNNIKLEKDVDGFKAENLGLLFQNDSNFIAPSTPAGIMEMLKRYKIDLTGKDVVVVGRSNIVGKPVAALVLNAHGTVTICNSYTKNLQEKTRNADILISAVGKPEFIKADMVKEGAVVIDVGINKIGNKIVGDIDFENVKDKVSHITPVPGGIGTLTVAMLFSNILKAFKKNRSILEEE